LKKKEGKKKKTSAWLEVIIGKETGTPVLASDGMKHQPEGNLVK
jgi:hypothetical protein